ncbi:poly [ADP-ribose] polymerase 12-like, partial [Clarias magur]
MMQYKIQNGTEMRVRRRPTFLSAEDVQNAIKREKESEDRLQNPQALPYDSDEADVSVTGFERAPLDSDTDQYKKTVARFYRTMGDFNVKSIEKVQNKDLWEVFKRHVNVVKQKNLGKENVKLLFHGTEPKQIDAIFQQNTDGRFCEGQETAYGK